MAAEKKYFYATGRRKTSKARVFLKAGSGKVTVNGNPLEKFMPMLSAQTTVFQPLVLTDMKNRYDARVTVIGGGTNGQAEAIRMGIARALVAAAPELRSPLKKAGFLRRDSRMVERKKYGKHGARRSTQFSKR